MAVPFIDAATLGRALPMAAAIDALQDAFGVSASDRPAAPLRSRVKVGPADLLLMPAVGASGTGVKLVTVNPENPARGLPLIHAVYVLFAPGTLAPAAVIDGSALTGLRTAAVSGLATRFLARKEAARLVIFGAGVQAESHLDAMLAVRPVEWLRVAGRSAGPAKRLAALARERGLDAAAVSGEGAVEEVLGQADLVCACTTSTEPLFDGAWLRPGAHVNAVGSYQPHVRELDDVTMRRARGRIVVETREVTLAEAGDLLIPIASGAIGIGDVAADLAEVVGGAIVRRSEEDVTVFKSVGVAFEDLAVAGAAVERLGDLEMRDEARP
jgi:ornithine cyclodeaminase/alanine dehydrogenase-like protein (mu-crystallin family)